MPKTQVEYDAFLEKLESRLDALRNKSNILSLERARIIAAITLIKQLKADNYEIHPYWIDCVNFDKSVANYKYRDSYFCKLSSFLSSRYYKYHEDDVHHFFKEVSNEYKQHHSYKRISSRIYNRIIEAGSFINHFIHLHRYKPKKEQSTITRITPTSTDNLDEIEQAKKILLKLRVKINIALEELTIDFDKENRKLGLNIDTEQLIRQAAEIPTATTISSDLNNVSTLLRNGAQLAYGLEATRDDNSTKILEKYKNLTARTIDEQIAESDTDCWNRCLQNFKSKEVPEDNRDVFASIRKMYDIEQQYGNVTFILDSIKNLILKAEKADVEFLQEGLPVIKGSLMNENGSVALQMPAAVASLFKDSIQELEGICALKSKTNPHRH